MSSDNIKKYKGNHIFGKAYKRMFENLFNEKNSIDRVLDIANKGWPGGTRWLFKENL
ncbi:MAG: hypothetical protein ABIN20_08785 [candidate division WOR-3 bacterium]